MSLPLQELAYSEPGNSIVRLTENGLEFSRSCVRTEVGHSLIPDRPLRPGEQYRFHFNMTKCIGCRSCEVACNEQNGNPADIRWRRIGEIEGGTYPYVTLLSLDGLQPLPFERIASRLPGGCLQKRPCYGHRPPLCRRMHWLSVLRLELPLLCAAVQRRTRCRRQMRHVLWPACRRT